MAEFDPQRATGSHRQVVVGMVRVRPAVDDRYDDRATAVVERDRRAARQRAVGDAEHAVAQLLATSGLLPPEPRTEQRGDRLPVDGDRDRRGGGCGARAARGLDHRFDGEAADVVGAPDGCERSVLPDAGVGGRRPGPAGLVPEALDLNDGPGIVRRGASAEAQLVAQHGGGPARERDAVTAGADRHVRRLDRAIHLRDGRTTGAHPGTARRRRRQGGSGEQAGGYAKHRSQIAVDTTHHGRAGPFVGSPTG